MRTRTLVAALALLGSTTSLACTVLDDDVGSQESEHRENDPTYARYPWLWADDTLEEFTTHASDSDMDYYGPQFLPVDHPMAQRLQFWVDRMDEALRKNAPEAMSMVPKPRIVLKKDEDPNAWVSSLPVVWNVPAVLAADPAPEQPGADGDAGVLPDADAAPPPAPAPDENGTPFLLSRNGTISMLEEHGRIERPHDATSLDQFLRYTNGGFAKCRLALDHDRLVVGKGCVGDEPPYAKRTKSFAFRGTSKWITVTTGLLTSMLDEDRVLAVLAHELGHYYRTHASMPTDVVNYFYDLEKHDSTSKPSPDPRFLEQTLKAREKLRKGWGWFLPDFKEENAFMQEQRLGFYTTEQEADELSLELLARIGVPPSVGPDSQLMLQKIVEDLTRDGWGGQKDSGDLKWEQCTALRDRGWKDDAGRLVSVPVGDVSDSHHSFCFRVFNMVLELGAHRYPLASERPRPPGEGWTKLLQRVMNDVDPPPPPVVDAGPAPVEAGPAPVDAGAPAPSDDAGR